MKNKKITAALLSLFVLFSLFTFTASCYAGDIDITKDGATVFTFSDDKITAENGSTDSFKIKGTALTISASGTYVLTGECSAGSINVKKGTKGVNLVLSGLYLTASDATAALVCSKSSEVNIYADKGTVNTLTDTQNNNDELTDNSGEALYPDAENAVIKCKDGSQVTLTGSGTLNVNAKGKNGIKSGATTEDEGEAFLTVKNLTLNVTATATDTANDGINAEQLLNLESGNVTVSANDDGIHSDLYLNIGAEGTAGPVVKVLQSEEGIEAAELKIYSGDISVTAEDDGINAANSDLDNYAFTIEVYGGKLYVNAKNGDGIDSNGKLTLAGGTVEVYASARGDNSPLDSDSAFSVTGGTVFAVGNSQMAQTPASGSQTCVIFGSSKSGGFFGFGGSSGISISAGDTLTVCDGKNNVLFEGKSLRSANYVIFSSAALTVDESYTLKINGSAAATQTAEAPNGSTFTPGGPGGPGGNRPDNNDGNGSDFSISTIFGKISEFFGKIFDFFKSLLGIN